LRSPTVLILSAATSREPISDFEGVTRGGVVFASDVPGTRQLVE
jgi:hypothetical protein